MKHRGADLCQDVDHSRPLLFWLCALLIRSVVPHEGSADVSGCAAATNLTADDRHLTLFVLNGRASTASERKTEHDAPITHQCRSTCPMRRKGHNVHTEWLRSSVIAWAVPSHLLHLNRMANFSSTTSILHIVHAPSFPLEYI